MEVMVEYLAARLKKLGIHVHKTSMTGVNFKILMTSTVKSELHGVHHPIISIEGGMQHRSMFEMSRALVICHHIDIMSWYHKMKLALTSFMNRELSSI